MRRISPKKKLLFSVIVLFAFYATIETLASVVAYHTWWGEGLWFFEDVGRTIQFDAVRGYRLTTTPSRVIGITDGIVEYVGTLRGNCQGFPDRDDFWPKRPQGSARRIAVFGDSFTAAQYLGQNWPDRAEDLAREAAEPIQLLNFAIYAAGLANWHRVLLGIVDLEGYEIDGMIFAVYGNDLWRTFYLADDRGAKQYTHAVWPSWNPATYPATLEEARPYLRSADNSYVLTSEEFERPLQGRWPGSVPRYFKPIFLTMAWRRAEPYASRAWRSALPYVPGIGRPALPDDLRPTGHALLDLASLKYRDVMIRDIKRFCEARHLPTTVAYIPDRAELLGGDRASQAFAEARDFAGTLGAIFLDGREIFEGMSRAEIRAHYLPYNGHWNQAGSNRFAEFVVRRLCLPKGQPDGRVTDRGGHNRCRGIIGPCRPGDRSRGLPRIRTCAMNASGSSDHAGATGRHTEWTAIAGRSGWHSRKRSSRSQVNRPPRRRRDGRRPQIRVATAREQFSTGALPVIP